MDAYPYAAGGGDGDGGPPVPPRAWQPKEVIVFVVGGVAAEELATARALNAPDSPAGRSLAESLAAGGGGGGAAGGCEGGGGVDACADGSRLSCRPRRPFRAELLGADGVRGGGSYWSFMFAVGGAALCGIYRYHTCDDHTTPTANVTAEGLNVPAQCNEAGSTSLGHSGSIAYTPQTYPRTAAPRTLICSSESSRVWGRLHEASRRWFSSRQELPADGSGGSPDASAGQSRLDEVLAEHLVPDRALGGLAEALAPACSACITIVRKHILNQSGAVEWGAVPGAAASTSTIVLLATWENNSADNSFRKAHVAAFPVVQGLLAGEDVSPQ